MRHLVFAIPVVMVVLNSMAADQVDTSVKPYLPVLTKKLSQHSNNLCRISTSFPISTQHCGKQCESLLVAGLIETASIGELANVKQYVLTAQGRDAYIYPYSESSIGNFCFGAVTGYQVIGATALDAKQQTTITYQLEISNPHPLLHDLEFTKEHFLPYLKKGANASEVMQQTFYITTEGATAIVQ